MAAGASYLVVGRPILKASGSAGGRAGPGGRPDEPDGDRRRARRATARSRARLSWFCGYFAVKTKWPRRFCDQQASFSSVQKGASLPLLTARIAIPRHAQAHQVVAHGSTPALAEAEVVLGCAAAVAVAFDA